MAYIVCPECGRKLSEDAKECVRCGYRFPRPLIQKGSVKAFFKNRKKVAVLVAALCVVLIAVGVWLYLANYDKTPTFFDNISTQTTYEEIYQVFKAYDSYEYSSTSIVFNEVDLCGLKASVDVFMNADANGKPTTLQSIRWRYPLGQYGGIDQEDYQFGQFYTAIHEDFTREYGDPVQDELNRVVWKTETGDTYIMTVDLWDSREHLMVSLNLD